MRVAAFILLALCLSPLPAAAKPKGCLTTSEMLTEQLVRHGVFLREASALCNDRTPGSGQMWKDFDGQYGSRLASYTARRTTVFKREFPKTWLQMMTYFDGRMVTFYRNKSTDLQFCNDVMKLLTKNQRGGWSSYARQAKAIQDNVRLDFSFCGQ